MWSRSSASCSRAGCSPPTSHFRYGLYMFCYLVGWMPCFRSIVSSVPVSVGAPWALWAHGRKEVMTIPSSVAQRQGLPLAVQSAKRLLGACAVGCVVAVLAACGSSSPRSPSASSSSPVSSSSPATSASAATPASPSQLKAIVLQPADLTYDSMAAPSQSSPFDSVKNAAVLQCLGVPNTDSDKVAEAYSDIFAVGNAIISSNAASYRSQSDLDTVVAALRSPKTSPCLEQMIRTHFAASLSAGDTIKSASIKVTPGSAGGPANVVATGTGAIVFQVSGKQYQVSLNIAFITGPLIEAEVDAEDAGTPVPASLLNPLVATVATRAAKG